MTPIKRSLFSSFVRRLSFFRATALSVATRVRALFVCAHTSTRPYHQQIKRMKRGQKEIEGRKCRQKRTKFLKKNIVARFFVFFPLFLLVRTRGRAAIHCLAEKMPRVVCSERGGKRERCVDHFMGLNPGDQTDGRGTALATPHSHGLGC